ncbi:MAG: hypothetical protein INR71_09560, partial [Terriglobus roseus]|nr:hypothetical protein [Terriglobus roseus]
MSLLSTLTGFSERSSGSNSTVTQQSYNKTIAKVNEDLAKTNVFDYMMPSSRTAYIAQRSSQHASPASSTYAASDGAFSDGLGTPSSRSTAPSPTDLHFKDVKRTSRSREYRSNSATSSTRGNGNSSGSSNNSSPDNAYRTRQPPAMSAVNDNDGSDDDDDANDSNESDDSDDHNEPRSAERADGYPPVVPNVPTRNQRFDDSHDSDASRRSRQPRSQDPTSADRLRLQEEHRRQHMAYAADAHVRG